MKLPNKVYSPRNPHMFLSVVLGMALSSCSMLSVKKDKVAEVKKVAVVAFSVQHEMPTGATISLGGGSGDGTMSPMMAMPKVVKAADFVDSMYQNFSTHLEKKMSWKVMKQKEVAQNDRYRSVYTAQTSGWQNRPPSPEGTEPFAATGILDEWSFKRLSQRERDELMSQLGVDAIAAVNHIVALERGGGLKKLVGAVEYSPQATLQFQLFKRGEENPVWSDYKAEGPASDKSIQAILGHASEDKIFVETIVAANKAYDKLSTRYERGEE